MNDRPETKREKFERIRDSRLPKIIHALGLLENLAGSAYENTVQDAEELVAQLDEAVDKVAKAFGIDAPASAGMIDDAVSQALTTPLTETSSPPEKPDSVPLRKVCKIR